MCSSSFLWAVMKLLVLTNLSHILVVKCFMVCLLSFNSVWWSCPSFCFFESLFVIGHYCLEENTSISYLPEFSHTSLMTFTNLPCMTTRHFLPETQRNNSKFLYSRDQQQNLGSFYFGFGSGYGWGSWALGSGAWWQCVCTCCLVAAIGWLWMSMPFVMGFGRLELDVGFEGLIFWFELVWY